MKYELLNITADPGQNYTYRIRVTNKCANKLIYTAIQVPDGVIAMEPLGQTIFTSENGIGYAVNSPNYSPFYSIRFKSTTDSIANGESEIFRYTLPAQAVPVYINITSRLVTQEFYESHLNTFYCPIGVTPTNNKPAERNLMSGKPTNNLRVFPNPNAGELFIDLSDWEGQNLQIRLLDVYGKQLQVNEVQAEASLYQLQVPQTLPNGLYFIEVTDQNNSRQTSRMVLHR
jgi:hypothetical protein